MFFIVYKKSDNEIVHWRYDTSTATFMSAEEAVEMYCKPNDLNVDDYGCYAQEDFNDSIVPHAHMIDPETGDISDNPDYVPPVEGAQPE